MESLKKASPLVTGVLAVGAWSSGRRKASILLLLASAALYHAFPPGSKKRKKVVDAVVNQSEPLKFETKEEEEFHRAQAFASHGLSSDLSTASKLELYALFKQGTIGPCNTQAPSMLDFTASAKWKAWKQLGDMPRHTAQVRYVELVDKLGPDNWRDCETTEGLKDQHKPQKTGMGLSVSTMKVEEKDDSEMTHEERLIDLAMQGRVEDLVRELERLAINLDAVTGEGGQTLLHVACDRGDLQLTRELIRLGHDVEAADEEGLTPVCYAALNDHHDMAVTMVREFNASLQGETTDGESFISFFSEELVAKLRVK